MLYRQRNRGTTDEQPAKCTTKSDGRENHGKSVELFISPVPHTQIKHDSREVPAFCNAQKEASGEESTETLGKTREGTNDTPYESESRKPEPRRRELEGNVAWNIEHNVTDEVDGQCCKELVPGLLRIVVREVPKKLRRIRTHVCICDQTLDASISNWKKNKGKRMKGKEERKIPLLRSKNERRRSTHSPGRRCKSIFLKSFLSSIAFEPSFT